MMVRIQVEEERDRWFENGLKVAGGALWGWAEV